MVYKEQLAGNREHILQNPEIKIAEFADLTPRQVASLYAIRYNVFVREQKSIYNEHDGQDFEAIHHFVEDGDRIIAYARVCRDSETTASIGRVVVDKAYRGQGLGRKIVGQTIETILNMQGVKTINLAAQTYLQQFYESFGFRPIGQPYDDAGVMHIDMSMSL